MWTSRTVALALVVIAGVAAPAGAQPDRHYAEEPTEGINLPAAPLAGDADARSVALNPAGLAFAEPGEIMLALDLVDEDEASTAGSGVGAWSTVWPGLGVGIEALRAPRKDLVPDPGTPTRLSVAYARTWQRDLAFGVAWRHFLDHGPTDGLDTVDAGVSWRGGNHIAVGGVVRDVFAPEVAGTTVQRRYELEVAVRPLGTDRLDVGLGGQIGEDGNALDGWFRASARIFPGITLHGEVASRELDIFDTTGTGTIEKEGRDARVTLGLELSFGKGGIAIYGAGRRTENGDTRALGGTLVARWSGRGGPPSIFGHPDRIERLELSGTLSTRAVVDVIARLRAVVRDPGARAVVVTLDSVSGGWASLEEIHDELLKVRAAKKKVFAYMVAGTGRDYYVATAADRIYVDPAGGIRLVGMSGTLLYYRGAFDIVGVDPEFEKIAEYKSAPEALTQTGPSEAAAQMRNELYDSMWNQFVAAIAAGRKLDEATVKELIDAGPYTAGDLAKDKAHRLVDAVANPEKVAELVSTELGDLPPVMGPPVEKPDRWKLPAIAVIYADGDIVDGRSSTIPIIGRKLVGAETLSSALAAARADPDILGIILRIDSPGGSALASEIMAREVFKTRGVKPIVCSLGDIAASGGYFLAAGCDLIYAEPMSVTGSIGIFYGKFDVSGLLGKLGVTSDTYKRGKRADMESLYRPYTDEERKVLLEKLEYLYGRFVGAVAEGRGMDKTAVDAVGRGHVWSGGQAKPLGLVDRLGGIGDALDEVKRQVGLGPKDKVRLVSLPRASSSLLGRLLGSFLGRADADAAPELDLGHLAPARAVLDAVPPSVLVDPTAPQARLPFELLDGD